MGQLDPAVDLQHRKVARRSLHGRHPERGGHQAPPPSTTTTPRSAPPRSPPSPIVFDEASLGAGGDEYNDCVFNNPLARVYDEEAVLCVRALARAAPADSDAHLVCAPPEVLVFDYTPCVLDPAPDAKKLLASLNPSSDAKKKKLLAPLVSPLECLKDALAGLVGFFAFV